MLSTEQVSKHNSRESCWVIIKGQVYDVTNFLDKHPGGISAILRYGGQDATEGFDPIHPPNTLKENLSSEQCLGPIDPDTVKLHTQNDDSNSKSENKDKAPLLEECLSLDDFEKAAEAILTPKAWAYYKSASDNEYSANHNHKVFEQVSFRPRILRDVSNIDLRTTILGYEVSMPVFISPAAMGRLAHPDGEFALSRAAENLGILYMLSANASCSFEEIAAEPRKRTPLFYQLYVNRNRKKTESILRRVVEAGYKAIVLTVDAPANSRRLRDERMKMVTDRTINKRINPGESIGAALATDRDSSLKWEDLAWIREVTGLPLVVKGIQCAEDAALCASHGVQGIVLSNHGGRQLNYAQTGLETLLEIRRDAPGVFDRCEVYIDGGVRSGTDVVKALCLGAQAVGIGRPFMYSLVYGQEGVEAAGEIVRAEVEIALQLLGCSSVSTVQARMTKSRL